jgi:hypothetical protein
MKLLRNETIAIAAVCFLVLVFRFYERESEDAASTAEVVVEDAASKEDAVKIAAKACSWAFYLEHNADLAGLDAGRARSHYLTYGFNEGRICNDDARWKALQKSALHQITTVQTLLNSPDHARECRRAVDIRVDLQGSIHAAIEKPCNRLPSEHEMSSTQVTIFWLIGPGEWTQQVVDEQTNEMRQSGLLARASNIYVWGQDYDRAHSSDAHTWVDLFKMHPDAAAKVHAIDLGAAENKWWSKQGNTFEFPALQGAWQFCQQTKDVSSQAILYLHSKGSTKQHWQGDEFTWRQIMSNFALRNYKSCLANLGCGYSTCGSALQKGLLTQTPWMHYSGNFWWARCDYLVGLDSPKPSIDTLEIQNPKADGIKPEGRFLAEWWLFSKLSTSRGKPVFIKNCWGTPQMFIPNFLECHAQGTMSPFCSKDPDAWRCNRKQSAHMPLDCNDQPVVLGFDCAIGQEDFGATHAALQVGCPGRKISSIDYAVVGDLTGNCASGIEPGACGTTSIKELVESVCLGEEFCVVTCRFVHSWKPGCSVSYWSDLPADAGRNSLQYKFFEVPGVGGNSIMKHGGTACDSNPKSSALKISCGA